MYIPTYPRQTLPETPHAVLCSQSSQTPPVQGDIDPDRPHDINSLTIGELGCEEVLVSAHDDGDVCVWYTRDLSRMALRDNVGRSAWGVTIHKERRLLAVSSNTHDITVFELGVRHGQGGEDCFDADGEEYDDECGSREEVLRRVSLEPAGSESTRKRTTRDEDGTSDETEDGLGHRQNGGTRPQKTGFKRRKGKETAVHDTSIRKVLRGHGHNVPSISFLDDSSGRWLAGVSYDGMVILWDVHTQRMVEKCKLAYVAAMGWSYVVLICYQ